MPAWCGVSSRPARPLGSRTGDNHHHLVCRACGRTTDVDCAVGGRPCLTPSDDAGYEVDEAEVLFWGLCPTANEKIPKQTRSRSREHRPISPDHYRRRDSGRQR